MLQVIKDALLRVFKHLTFAFDIAPLLTRHDLGIVRCDEVQTELFQLLCVVSLGHKVEFETVLGLDELGNVQLADFAETW